MRMTMTIHHQRHHGAFITNLNGLVGRWAELATMPPEAIVSDLSKVPEAIRTPVRNNLGGHWNHTFFWDLMAPGGAKEPTGDLKAAIDRDFEQFRCDEGKAQRRRPRPLRLGLGMVDRHKG